MIRVSLEEKSGFENAARLCGIGLSAWARERLRSAAIHELQQAGLKIPFVKTIPFHVEASDGTHG